MIWLTGVLKKNIFGEVDIFKIFEDYELFGTMNINYLKIDEIPSMKMVGSLFWMLFLEENSLLQPGRF
ncbi:MAG: hypothetical protein Ct9H90mP25_4300 [Gammaproteobacteria bacterium]|nr:MAG: hypothetical protein Ct9H90mP25_4300 [Gammaproteobacteria bacterium]